MLSFWGEWLPFLPMKTRVRLYLYLTVFAFLSEIFTLLSQTVPIGNFESHGDVGLPKLAGSASYDPARQSYTLSGAGSNMWFTTDQFQFLWRKMKGDFILRTRVEFIGKSANAHRKVGWMVRPSLETGAPYADCVEHGDGLTSLQFRRAVGSNTGQISMAISNADVLQFERRSNTYSFSAARYGEPFVSSQLANFNLGDEVYAGLFICSHSADKVETAVFRDVRIIRPAPEGFVPYRDYIGSVMEILNVHTGQLEQIYRSDQPFEAPNWTRDGQTLIYNISGRGEGRGRLCRFDLATRTPLILNTGSCLGNNNDHVLSFEGTMLGISDQSADHGGKSRIFTMPVAGGEPGTITPQTPSYLHGWSPDGKFLVYTGGRNEKFDIYKTSSAGGATETRLTDAPGLNDGPEYTPDGKYIYFNSSRSGTMQLWRMKSDGQDQEPVTNDDFNNWFPHISPDGKWIAFLSYSKEVEATDHPYYKQIYLRLLPIEGGKPKVIAYVYGGQGTMNVSSWSPDSGRIAFVSNTR
jgi:Tol biopolymer transport system component